MGQKFIDLLLDETEAMLGAIGLFQGRLNVVENRVDYNISQVDLACLMYVLWPHVAQQIGAPHEANPQDLFLRGLTKPLNEPCEHIAWSDFANELGESSDPFLILNNTFAQYSTQRYFSVDTNKLQNGKAFVNDALANVHFYVGQIVSRINVFLQTLLIVNNQNFTVQERIDCYMRLFLAFNDRNLIRALENADIVFYSIDGIAQGALRDIMKERGNTQLRDAKNFIFNPDHRLSHDRALSLDDAIFSIAGKSYKLGKTFYFHWKLKAATNHATDNLDFQTDMSCFPNDVNTNSFFFLFSGFFYVLFTLQYSLLKIDSLCEKYENFYYWLQNALYITNEKSREE